jgi:lycopene beta-cyclase
VESLVRYGTPWRLPRVSRRHQLYDSLLLDVLARRGRQGAAIFAAMFRRNPLARVLHFLEAASTPAEELALIATLPSGLFLRALPGWLAGSLPGRLRPAAR